MSKFKNGGLNAGLPYSERLAGNTDRVPILEQIYLGGIIAGWYVGRKNQFNPK